MFISISALLCQNEAVFLESLHLFADFSPLLYKSMGFEMMDSVKILHFGLNSSIFLLFAYFPGAGQVILIIINCKKEFSGMECTNLWVYV